VRRGGVDNFLKVPDDPEQRSHILEILEALDAAKVIEDLDGFRWRQVGGRKYAVYAGGGLWVTFEWKDGMADDVDLEQLA
jgi:hypothetical protein